MPIDIDIAYVARLARLQLDADELEFYGTQLEVILTHAARVQEVAASDVEPTAHALPLVNAFRQDEVVASLDRDEVLAQAPEAEEGFFRVPPALEDEP